MPGFGVLYLKALGGNVIPPFNVKRGVDNVGSAIARPTAYLGLVVYESKKRSK
jgi:hypothetical protein